MAHLSLLITRGLHSAGDLEKKLVSYEYQLATSQPSSDTSSTQCSNWLKEGHMISTTSLATSSPDFSQQHICDYGLHRRESPKTFTIYLFYDHFFTRWWGWPSCPPPSRLPWIRYCIQTDARNMYQNTRQVCALSTQYGSQLSALVYPWI